MLKKQLPIFILAGSVLFSSCHVDEIENSKQEVVDQNTFTKSGEYSGEELFSSIFFLGDAVKVDSDYFNELRTYKKTLSSATITEIDLMSDRLIKAIQITDKTFFTDFADAIYSDDNYKIEDAIKRGSDLIEQTLPTIPEYNDPFKKFAELSDTVDFQKYIDEDGKFHEDDFLQDIGEENVVNFITPTIIAISVAVIVVQTVGLGVSYWVAIYWSVYTPWDKQIKKHYNNLMNNKKSLSKEVLIQQLVDEI